MKYVIILYVFVQPLPPATPPKDVIARAVANGLLSGVDLGDDVKGTEKVKVRHQLYVCAHFS